MRIFVPPLLHYGFHRPAPVAFSVAPIPAALSASAGQSFRIVVVLALVIGLLARVFDCDYEDDDDMKIAPSTKPGTLAALAEPSLVQPRPGLGSANCNCSGGIPSTIRAVKLRMC